LADSLPQDLLEQLRKESEMLEKALQSGAGVAPDRAREERVRALLRKAEVCLDSGLGRCFMRDPNIAKIVADALRCFHGDRYALLAWCIMPNHVHVLFSLTDGFTLETVLHSWKSYSAKEANRRLGRTGAFWQREYFDHVVRSESSLQRIMRYVQDNPLRAGLSNWPWVEVL
jgi:REP element-mobilizing transposase RayT